jgi:hypothetical protein
LSWIDELVPQAPTPARLREYLADAYRVYSDVRVPLVRRPVFLLMHAGQRIAYWLGWTFAETSRQGRTPSRYDSEA